MTAPATIAISAPEGIDVVSVISGVYLQSGQLGTITGGMFRGPIGNTQGRIGDAQITNLLVSDDGFVGHLRIFIGSCVYEGTIGGIRRSS